MMSEIMLGKLDMDCSDLFVQLKKYQTLKSNHSIEEFIRVSKLLVDCNDDIVIPKSLLLLRDTIIDQNYFEPLLSSLWTLNHRILIEQCLNLLPVLVKKASHWTAALLQRFVIDDVCFEILKDRIPCLPTTNVRMCLSLVRNGDVAYFNLNKSEFTDANRRILFERLDVLKEILSQELRAKSEDVQWLRWQHILNQMEQNRALNTYEELDEFIRLSECLWECDNHDVIPHGLLFLRDDEIDGEVFEPLLVSLDYISTEELVKHLFCLMPALVDVASQWSVRLLRRYVQWNETYEIMQAYLPCLTPLNIQMCHALIEQFPDEFWSRNEHERTILQERWNVLF